MPYGYGQGDKSRNETLREYVKDFYSEKGYSTLSYAKETQLVNFVLNIFKTIVEPNLKAIKNFLTIMGEYCETVNYKVNIKTPYLSWSFLENQMNFSRHSVGITKKGNKTQAEHKFVLYHNFGIDPHKIRTTVNSILIQGFDATMVQNILDRTSQINKELKAAGFPTISFVMNHDTFELNSQYAIFLEPLIMLAYNFLNSLELPKSLNLLNKHKKTINCTNPNCAKH